MTLWTLIHSFLFQLPKIKQHISSFYFIFLKEEMLEFFWGENESQLHFPSQAHDNILIMYSVLISVPVPAPPVTSEWKVMNRCPNLLYNESGQSLITLCTVAQVNLPDWSKQCVIVSTLLSPHQEVTLCLIKDWGPCVWRIGFTGDSVTVC